MGVMMVGVHRDYRRCGLARVLTLKSMQIAREHGCAFVHCEAIALGSQRLYEQLGFETAGVLEHDEWTVDGKRVFACDDGTTCGKLMIYRL